MTALRFAMKKAGIKTPAERLDDLARAALDASPDALTPAVEQFLNAVRNDADLLWAMFESHADMEARAILRRIRGERGQAPFDTHNVAAPSPKPQPPVSAKPQPPVSLQPRRGFTAIASAAKTAERAYLSRVTEIGKPLGECTKADLERLAAIHAHHRWLYDAIGRSMPPTGQVAAFYDDRALAELDRKWNGDRK